MKPRERSKLLNSLIVLLKGLEGKVTTIELRNESSIQGRIEHVDYLMNTTISDAVVLAPDGSKLMTCEEFFVQVNIFTHAFTCLHYLLHK